MLTTALAKRVMGTHIMKSGGKGTASAALDFLHAVYVVDRNGTLWFSHAANMHMRLYDDNIEDDEVESRVVPKRQFAVNELENLLQEATSSGASMEEYFSHFDSFDQR